MPNAIFIKNNQNLPLPAHCRKLIGDAVRATLKEEGITAPCEVSLTFTDDGTIHSLNREYRKVNKPTDVLSFPIFDEKPDEEGRLLLGDIVISVETAYRQAEEYGHSIERELSFLTVHSMLHLLGYDHETSKKDETEMFTKQDAIMSRLGLER